MAQHRLSSMARGVVGLLTLACVLFGQLQSVRAQEPGSTQRSWTFESTERRLHLELTQASSEFGSSRVQVELRQAEPFADRVDQDAHWQPYARHEAQLSPHSLESTFETRLDRMRWVIPSDLERDGRTSSAIVIVEVNGVPIEIGAEEFLDMVEAPGSPLPRRLEAAARHLVDPESFVKAYVDMANALERASLDLDAGPGCFLPCLGCTGAFGGFVASSLAMIAGCGGSTVATGGVAAVGCVAILLRHYSTGLVVFAACASCHACLAPPIHLDPPCPCAGQPECICDDVPDDPDPDDES